MKKHKLFVVGMLLFAALVVGILMLGAQKLGAPPLHHGTEMASVHSLPAAVTTQIPAYQSAEQARSLGPTLEPAQFFGKAREAYQVAKNIPGTLAQLPCYCHCDKSFGHKSLHTCFEDDHASHCAVCVDEALLAYQLQTQEKLTPQQVRDRIVKEYSAAHGHQ